MNQMCPRGQRDPGGQRVEPVRLAQRSSEETRRCHGTSRAQCAGAGSPAHSKPCRSRLPSEAAHARGGLGPLPELHSRVSPRTGAGPGRGAGSEARGVACCRGRGCCWGRGLLGAPPFGSVAEWTVLVAPTVTSVASVVLPPELSSILASLPLSGHSCVAVRSRKLRPTHWPQVTQTLEWGPPNAQGGSCGQSDPRSFPYQEHETADASQPAGPGKDQALLQHGLTWPGQPQNQVLATRVAMTAGVVTLAPYSPGPCWLSRLSPPPPPPVRKQAGKGACRLACRRVTAGTCRREAQMLGGPWVRSAKPSAYPAPRPAPCLGPHPPSASIPDLVLTSGRSGGRCPPSSILGTAWWQHL